MNLFSSISIKDKALFYESTANLLEGWVTLLSALHGLHDRLTDSRLKEAIDHLIFFIEWGDAVNIAMRKLPHLFSEGEVAIVESGEQTGMLQKAFLSLANDLRDQEALRGKIISATTYPVIVMMFLVLAFIVVMAYVVPQLLPIISQMSGELPIMTRTLIWVSSFLSENIISITIVSIALISIFIGYIRTDMGRYRWDMEKIRFPLTGNVYKNYLVVRTMSTLHLLISSWVSIVKTLRLTGESSGNVVIKKLFLLISDDVAHGTKISESMRNQDAHRAFFTPDILQMIESAERTSTLDSVTDTIHVQYKREVDVALGMMVKFIEPIALLLAGLFVLWFAIAIFSAIMQIVSLAGN